MAAVCSMGPRYLLLTDGIDGAYLGTRDELMFCPALKVQVAGTAGAGDAFTSTFATFIAFGSKPEQALRAATVNAASVVSYVDTQTGLLPRAEIEKRIAAHDRPRCRCTAGTSIAKPTARRSGPRRQTS